MYLSIITTLLSWILTYSTLWCFCYHGYNIFISCHAFLLSWIQYIYLFGVLRHFQHCTGHIMTGSWKGRGNQYIQLVKVLYCKLPAFPLKAMPGTEPQPQRWEARVLPLCHRGPWIQYK